MALGALASLVVAVVPSLVVAVVPSWAVAVVPSLVVAVVPSWAVAVVPSLVVAVVPSWEEEGFVGHAIIPWKHGLPLKKSGGDGLGIESKRRLICDS